MQIDPYILAFSAVTVIATIFMGFWSARRSKTASDFFVAGRSVSVGWNASAISGEYLSAASFMGVAGMVMSSGYDALWYPVCYACGYLFLLLFIAGPLRRFGAYTIPDFAEGRFDSPVFRKIAVCFVLFIGFFYTMPQMKGAGTTLAYIFPGLPYWAGVVLVGAVITLNVALGGMKGITLVQAFQYWAKMFAISVPIFVLMAVYGHYGKQLEANGLPQFGRAWFDPERFPDSFAKKELNPTFAGGKLEEILVKARRFGVGSLNWKFRTPNNPPLEEVSLSYEANRPRLSHAFTIYLDTNVPNLWSYSIDTSKVTKPTLPATAHQLRRYFGQLLETNGFTLVEVNPDASAIVLTKDLSKFIPTNSPNFETRKALPEKAPADSTWLSPFGPLTTKAAKAAKPTIVETFDYDGDLVGEASGYFTIVRGNEFIGFLKGYKHSHSRINTNAEQSIVSLAGEYATAVVWNDRSLSGQQTYKVRFSRSVLQKMLNLQLPARVEDFAFMRAFEASLATNGLTIIRSTNNFFKVCAIQEAKKVSKIIPLNPKPYSLLYTYSLIIALVCGTAGLPHILVRFYTNPDGVAAKRTTMWVMILIGIFYVFPPVFGVMGRNLFPELYSGIGAKGTDKIVLELPRLLNDKYAPLGSILSGITCAGAFAAFMSTFSGLLVSMTGAMAHDVYGRMFRPKSTPDQRMKMFKVFAVILGGVAVLLGSFVEPLEINFMVGQAFAIAAASYFPLLFMAVWWRKLTMKGAAVGMLTGGISAMVAISLTSFSTLSVAPGKMGELFAVFKPLNDFWAAQPLLRILCEQPALWAVPLAIGLMIVVSKFTAKEVPADIRMKMLVLHAPEKLGLKQEYIQEHHHGH